MAKVSDLKAQARELEKQGELEKALTIYRHVLGHLEGKPAIKSQLALYVKAGDLLVRLDRGAEAVGMYEQAAGHYADAGSGRSVTALCLKIFQADPSRADAFHEWAARLSTAGATDAAHEVLTEYAARLSLPHVAARLEGATGPDDRVAAVQEILGAPAGTDLPDPADDMAPPDADAPGEPETGRESMIADLMTQFPEPVADEPVADESEAAPAEPAPAPPREPDPDAEPEFEINLQLVDETPPAPPPAPPAPAREPEPPPVPAPEPPAAPEPAPEPEPAPAARRSVADWDPSPDFAEPRPSRRSRAPQAPVTAPPREEGKTEERGVRAWVWIAAAVVVVGGGGFAGMQILGGGGGDGGNGAAPPQLETPVATATPTDSAAVALPLDSAAADSAALPAADTGLAGEALALTDPPADTTAAPADTGLAGAPPVDSVPAPPADTGTVPDTLPTIPTPVPDPVAPIEADSVTVPAPAPVRLPPGTVLSGPIVVIPGLPVDSVVESGTGATRAVRVIQRTAAGERIELRATPGIALGEDTVGVSPPRVTVSGDTAVGTARAGTFMVNATAAVAPDALQALLRRLIVHRP